MCTASSRAGSRHAATHRGLRTLGIIGLVALGLLVVPHAAEVRQPVKVPRIGVLSFYAPPASPDWQQQLDKWPFWQGMRELGWREGRNIVIEFRWAEERLERLPLLATELVQRKVDAILALGGAEIADEVIR
jgi:putative ABC transport system substrate-binding protein